VDRVAGWDRGRGWGDWVPAVAACRPGAHVRHKRRPRSPTWRRRGWVVGQVAVRGLRKPRARALGGWKRVRRRQSATIESVVLSERAIGEAGLAEAYQRLSERIADPATGEPLLSLAETLEWCYSLEEYLRHCPGRAGTYFLIRDQDPDGQTLAGLIYARGLFTLDPGLGIVHADAKGRQSLALDIMEPIRPEVDAFVLDMVERRTFRKAEFTETSDGHVRLLAPLTHELAETIPQWVKSLGPIAEHVAHVFGKAMDGSYSAATPLTSRRHRDAQAVIKARKVEATRRAAAGRVLQRPVAQPVALALWTCPDCGGAVTNPRHVRCEACIDADPAQASEIRGRRGAAIAARKRALAEWDKANPDLVYDPELFRREILPRLATVKLMDIAEAAGCSKASASDIRRGKWAPHVSTWTALGELVAFRTQRRRSADMAL